MKRIFAVLSISAILSIVALGAVAEGKWRIEGSDRTAPKVLSLHVNGSALSGTLDGVAIAHGGVEGNYLWFQLVSNGVTTQFKGKIAGGKIQLREVGPQVQRSLVFAPSR
jgi:hypothetical protein